MDANKPKLSGSGASQSNTSAGMLSGHLLAIVSTSGGSYWRDIACGTQSVMNAQAQLARPLAQFSDQVTKPLLDSNMAITPGLELLRSAASSTALRMISQQLTAINSEATKFMRMGALSDISRIAGLGGMAVRIPKIPVATSAWAEPLKRYARISNHLARQLHAAVPHSTLSAISKVLQQSAELHRENLRLAALPSNLRAIEGLTSDVVMDFTLAHGVSLYLVAPTNVARSFLRAKDRNAVRRILGIQREAILSQCEITLARCDSQETLGMRQALGQSIAAMSHDLYYPAQATAAVVLDRLSSDITHHSDSSLGIAAKRLPNETASDFRNRLHELDQWEEYIAAALWTAFAHYFRSRGDRVPSTFSRHASTHALGGRQYNRRSAVQGIMAATSVVAYLNGLT